MRLRNCERVGVLTINWPAHSQPQWHKVSLSYKEWTPPKNDTGASHIKFKFHTIKYI